MKYFKFLKRLISIVEEYFQLRDEDTLTLHKPLRVWMEEKEAVQHNL